MHPRLLVPSRVSRLGGPDVLVRAVEALYELALDDPVLAPVFARVDLDTLRRHQAHFLGEVLGSPDPAVGERMRRAHAGLEITPGQFARMAEHLARALATAGADPAAAQEIVDQVGGLSDDVIGR